jgi:hypothetical protein
LGKHKSVHTSQICTAALLQLLGIHLSETLLSKHIRLLK